MSYGDEWSTVDYEYDNNGNLGIVKDGFTGRKTKYLYDFADRLMRTEEEGANYYRVLEWEYDVSNNLKKVKEDLNGESYTTEYEYDSDNRPTSITNGGVKTSYSYDALSRVNRWSYSNNNTERVVYEPLYTSREDDAAYTSTQIASLEITSGSSYNKTITYGYDAKGNISSVEFNDATTTYEYDDLSQLVRENNQAANKTWVYTYDGGGNITQKAEYAYTTEETLGTALDVISYGYAETQWGDLLTSYDGVTITSDEIGNMLSDGEWTYLWSEGRSLGAMIKGNELIIYDYNADGLRTIKATDDKQWDYIYNGSSLVHMTDGTNEIHFNYDANGVMGFTYNGDVYFYIKNAQGDVIGIANAGGTIVAEYTYDAWGNILSTTGNTTVATVNPFRYRSYFYDTETGLYYLNSRYYDPELGRFICADGLVSTGQGLLGSNMFAYCGNNPVNRKDPDGQGWIVALIIIAACAGLTGCMDNYPSVEADSDPTVRDVTKEVNDVLFPTAQKCFFGRNLGIVKYYEFYNMVNHEAEWDLKVPKSWEETIGTPYPGNDTPIKYNGSVMTVEALGNYTYGYLGYAFGISLPTLYGGSYYAAGFPTDNIKLLHEFKDWEYITQGYIKAKFKGLW